MENGDSKKGFLKIRREKEKECGAIKRAMGKSTTMG